MVPADGAGPSAEFVVHRVGPLGTAAMAADRAFAVALITLWHKVASAGTGSVGFVPPVTRPEVAARVAGVVDDCKLGRTQAVAVTAGRILVGFGQLTPGVGLTSHTGHVQKVMVDPDHQHRGVGTLITDELLGLARELGLERVDLSVRSGEGLEEYYARFGFTPWGRRPGWIRLAPGDDRDEVFCALDLTAAQ